MSRYTLTEYKHHKGFAIEKWPQGAFTEFWSDNLNDREHYDLKRFLELTVNEMNRMNETKHCTTTIIPCKKPFR